MGKTLFAYNPDRTERWTHRLPSTMRRNSPGIAVDGKIFVGARDNRLWAIDSDGQPG